MPPPKKAKKAAKKKRLLPIKILEYKKVGRKLLEWTQDKSKWPKTIADLKRAMGDWIEVPERYKKLVVIQGDDETFILRIPPTNQAKQSIDDVAVEKDDADLYGYPPFYDVIKTPEKFKVKDFFHSRIADYTMRSCR